ncbi:MAG: hypothetical protein HFJ48_06200 [Clostridia bacterium]|nr:hypothetical protein [Clostridia bacterium]
MSNPEQLTTILTYTLVAIVILLFALIGAFAIVMFKNKQKEAEEMITKKETKEEPKKQSKSLGENKQSIHKFMEFDTVDDNMIIQDNGRRFLMVIECQGVNYDLMSGVEKTGVEDGFVQFLNTLRNPVQIYIQTRTVNLENSIQTYKNRLRKVEEKLQTMRNSYDEMVESGEYSQEQLDRAFFELTKQSNLCEYGKDVINNTEKMSLNKNILNKKYYIIVPYYSSELGLSNLDKEETKNLVFSELYTRAQSIVSSIASCGVRAKILKSNELVDLLYMAYNRDEAEVFGFDKAIRAGYDEIYSTAPEVLDKKMKELDKVIEQKAIEKAREKLNESMSEKQREVTEKEENLEDLIDELAKMLIDENEGYIEKDVIENAKNKIDEENNNKKAKEDKKAKKSTEKTKEGGNKNEERPKGTRGRKPKATTTKQ